MATIETLNKRIESKKKQIEKLNAKLERINAAKATGWTVNPYYYNEDDIRYTVRDINEATEAVAKYEAELAVALEKKASRNVEAIIEFLNNWKAHVKEYYMKGITAYYAERAEVKKLYVECAENAEEAGRIFYEKAHGKYEYVENPNARRAYERRVKVKVAEGEYEYVASYMGYANVAEAEAKLDKELNAEADRKYDFIIERTNKIVGQITDASALSVGASGDLNGYIKGTNATAKVQTIGAGGYNIQCYHFRTLIHKA